MARTVLLATGMVTRLFALGVAALGLIGVTEATAGVWKNGPQSNGIQNNGIQNNGIQNNGIQNNGIQNNGIQNNGIQNNGIQNNGVSTSGVTYNGISVVGTALSYIGQGTSVFPYTCSHREDVGGAALDSCSPCAKIVADADPYCKTTFWDRSCIAQATKMCTLGAGSVLTALFTDGRTAQMRLNSVTPGSSSYFNGTAYVDMSDVNYNTVTWVVEHAPNVTGVRLLAGANSCTNQVCNLGGAGYAADPYCCNNAWDSICVNKANAMCTSPASTVGRSVCGTTGKLQTPVQAIFVAGVWDQNWGAAGNGSKSASTTGFSIACRGIGAVAKCVDMGYKPWKSTALDDLHQTCVRAVRADYCGDGSSFTTDGRQIDIHDYFASTASTADDVQVSAGAEGFNYEATWDASGARCLEYPAARANGGFNAYNGQSFNEYFNARTTNPGDPSSNYCYVEPPGSGMSCFAMGATTGRISNSTYWVD